MPTWLDRLEPGAPALVSAFRALGDRRFIALRRAVRRAAGAGSAPGFMPQHAAVAALLDAWIATAAPEALSMPGGEEDRNVARALSHAIAARLRCRELLVFAGVHDLMHIEQLERLVAPR